MPEVRRSYDGRNELPNIFDKEVGLGSAAETEVEPTDNQRTYHYSYPKAGIPMLSVKWSPNLYNVESMIKIKFYHGHE